MIYHERDKARRRKKQIVGASVIGGIALVLVLAQLLFPSFISPIVHGIGVPVLYSQSAVSNGFGNFWGVLHSKSDLLKQNRDYKEQLASLNAVKTEEQALRNENDTLNALLGRSPQKRTTVLAHVLSKPNFSPYDTFIIDAGTKSGISIGDPVLVDQSVVIGEVASVYSGSANVLLYSAPDQKNSVFVGPKSIETTAIGKGGGVFEIKLPKNAGIAKDDIVTLAKEPDMIFGSIGSIDDTPADSFEQVLFTSPIDIAEVSYVTVETASTTHETVPNHH